MKLVNYSSEFQILNYFIISIIHLKYSYFKFFFRFLLFFLFIFFWIISVLTYFSVGFSICY